jgi:hypothetical protein
MTSWTARIDALLAEPEDAFQHRHAYQWRAWYERRLALAAERMREPHSPLCIDDMQDDYMREDLPTCTCGKDAELLRILEGR